MITHHINDEGPTSEIVTDTFSGDHRVHLDDWGALVLRTVVGGLVEAYAPRTCVTVEARS